MTDKRGKPPPRVEVIRRGPTPTPGTPAVRPSPTPAPAPAPSPSPSGARPPPRHGARPFRSSNRPPPTVEQIEALAKKERVPNRIAKGDLEGKMKCRIWRKLHAEEARRFDQAYTLMEKTPELSLPDAFAIVQSGMSLEELRARRSRTQRRDQVKKARREVPNEVVDAFFARHIEAKSELSIVLGGRTVLDSVLEVAPVSMTLARSGRLEKLQVVLIAPRELWEPLAPTLERDPKLSQKPATVSREPDHRPFSDPRPFLPAIGKQAKLTLRNGILLTVPLRAVGSFDLLVELSGQEALVPIHALVRWEPVEAG